MRPFDPQSVCALALAATLLTGLAGAQGLPATTQTAPGGHGGGGTGTAAHLPATPVPHDRRDATDLRDRYRVLDSVEAPFVDLNLPAVRPIVTTADGLHVFALNVHDSTVLHLDAESMPGTLLEDRFRTAWGPVAAAVHSPPDSEPELLIACRGSHVLAVHDLSGELLGAVPLEFEPADVLVFDALRRAYVACSGDDSVVEVDLERRAVARRFEIPSKHPMFLSRRGDRVLVTPLLSGNNSTIFPIGTEAFTILDLETSPFIAGGLGNDRRGLPDEDVFEIDLVSGAVEAVGVDFGTVLFGHGTNPATGAFWLLNTEHFNKDPERQTEPSVKGAFAANRLTIAAALPAGPSFPTTLDVRDLDDADPQAEGQQIDVTRTIGQPWSLDFASTGHALVTGMGTDNVAILAPNGDFVLDLDLPAGSIPRGAVWDATETLALVHAWGRNELIVFSIAPFSPDPVITFDLGFDPTPADRREGRALAYSAAHSQNNNLSCFTCHVDGGHDALVWNLSAPPEDSKGPLVTQTLRGIDKVRPYHWRGERGQLVNFNAAFPGLLGGAALETGPGSEFEKFEQFVFGIQNTANPNAHSNRVVSSTRVVEAPNGYLANAVEGQRIFFDGVDGVPGGGLCEGCHAAPTGTNAELQNTSVAQVNGHANFMKVAPFHALWRKDMPLTTIEFVNGVQRTIPVLGSGLSHGGAVASLFRFVDFFPIDDQATADVWSFVSQWDSGLAPAVHRAVFLGPETVDANARELTEYLVGQARRRNADVALVGRFDLEGESRSLAWVYVADLDRFVAEDSGVEPQTPQAFVDEARAGRAAFLALGLPVGSGERFAVDHDQDRLFNLDEVAAGTDLLDGDSDDDGFPDGHEMAHGSDPLDELSLPVDEVDPTIRRLRVLWANLRTARVSFETSEPCTYSLSYSTALAQASIVSGDAPALTHSVLLRDLLPSTAGEVVHEYAGTLTVTDAAGNTAQAALPELETRSYVQLGPIFVSKLGALEFAALGTADGGTALSAVVEARVDKVIGGPPAVPLPRQVVVARVLVNGELSTDWTGAGPVAFDVNGNPYGGLLNAHPGPFLISSVSGNDGRVVFPEFTQPGLVSGDVVTVNVEYVVAVDDAFDPLAPDFGFEGNTLPLGWWNIGETPAELRKVETTY